MKGLFINNKKAKDSIYESGLMVYNNLKVSELYSLEYLEINEEERLVPNGYDFYFFNYHEVTMRWLDTACIRRLPGLKITMVLEVLPGDPFVMCPKNHFDLYVVLDPTIKEDEKQRVYPFPRPLEKFHSIPKHIETSVPVIGTFGFATKGKGFHHVIDAVNKEFDKAVVRINIPHGNFVPESAAYAQFLADTCRKRAKEGIEVLVTHDYMTKDELVHWCTQNTLNCFLYDRNQPGLSATTDQAIVAKRPMAVSDNETFRHITAYLPPYPKWQLKESIERSLPIVEQMEREWTPENFLTKFEQLLVQNQMSFDKNKNAATLKLTSYNDSFFLVLKHRLKKYKRLFSLERIKKKYLKSNQQSGEYI